MSQGPNTPHDMLETRTRTAAPLAAGGAVERVPALTVLAHALAGRVGDRATLLGLPAGEDVALSRLAPGFSPPAGGAPAPLADPFLSRAPLAAIERRGAGVVLRRRRADALVRVDGADLAEERAIGPEELERGVVIELGGRCALLLHHVDAVPGRRPPPFGLVGESDAVQRLRREIARMGAADMRVLVRGETGAGKELVARAIHAASARASGPLVAINMAAIPADLAASALFGHVRGAFSGAIADHDGHFVAAHGGTLFLDEIGEADAAVQAMLLRALETGEVQRVGERRSRKVDVRLITATDADLEGAVAAGRFREPLLHRIGELSLRVPPLRARRDDIGRLVVAFLREMLTPEEQARLLDGEIAERPWLAPATVARLARAPWTGNIRQLRNVVRQLVVLGRDEPELLLSPDIDASLRDPTPAEAVSREAVSREAVSREAVSREAVSREAVSREAVSREAVSREAAGTGGRAGRGKGKKPQALTEAEILDALERTGWRRAAAAELLGIARSSLYTLIAEMRLTRASDLTREQIEEALARSGGDLPRAAADLHVSEHGLKLRSQALGLPLRK